VVILATIATIIASQAVISGTFSVVHQASRFEFLPPMRVIHTSRTSEGQIYLPGVNLLLAVTVIAIAIGFQSSAALASAYGIAVTSTISITAAVYLALRWSRARRVTWTIVNIAGILLIVLLLLAANLPKAASGGWLPLSIGAAVFILMVTWGEGRRRIGVGRHRDELPFDKLQTLLADASDSLYRVDGDAVFITRSPDVVPVALRTMVEANHALQNRVVLLSWSTADVPTTAGSDHRMTVEAFPQGIIQVIAKVGYRERPRMTTILAEAQEKSQEAFGDFSVASATFFVSTPVPRFNPKSRMFKWSQMVFLTLEHLAPDQLDIIDLPRNRTIVLGREIEL
jgi:KUP system potassium uptake protein